MAPFDPKIILPKHDMSCQKVHFDLDMLLLGKRVCFSKKSCVYPQIMNLALKQWFCPKIMHFALKLKIHPNNG